MGATPARSEDGGEGPDRPASSSSWRERARRMVEHLNAGDPRVVAAMCEVPRHLFVSPQLRKEAYEDRPLPVGPEATISAPHMVALQLGLSEISPGQRVLEVGSGSGYLLALLDRLVGPNGFVGGVEFEPGLADRARKNLSGAGARACVEVRVGDGAEGWAERAPFDRILVSYAVVGTLPDAWGAQLREGGFLVVPWAESGTTYLERLRRLETRLLRDHRGPACLFVPSKSAPGPRRKV